MGDLKALAMAALRADATVAGIKWGKRIAHPQQAAAHAAFREAATPEAVLALYSELEECREALRMIRKKAEDGRRTASLPYIKRVADAALGGPEL